MSTNQDKKISVLLEMRPALEGFAGIPQEVRLLFRGLCKIDSVEVIGMLQTSHKILAKGIPRKKNIFGIKLKNYKKINLFSRLIISLSENPHETFFDRISVFLDKKFYNASLSIKTKFFWHKIKLTKFESIFFEDFVWRTLFSKTLNASDFSLVSKKNFLVNSVPWRTMHLIGLGTLSRIFRATPRYPRLNTDHIDVFIGQTPYPARISPRTKLVIRYHDAIPVFMPHTIPDKSIHQATHYYALMNNVRSGAWFACVSEATRQELIRIFPEVAKRSIVIHNIVSSNYFDEDSKFELVPRIIRSRYYGLNGAINEWAPRFLTLREQENFFLRHLPKSNEKYLLIVSTIEPRKNHLRLLAAWEVLKAEEDPNIKLVVVGTLGWDNDGIRAGFKNWIDRGQIFMLNDVPAPDLRVLYRHAAATVCPSLGEGFDFSGVESMASGGITIASDIPVHREIYDDAAEFFDPYSTTSLVKSIKKVIYKPDSHILRAQMRKRGMEVSIKYQPKAILPKWEKFLNDIIVQV